MATYLGPFNAFNNVTTVAAGSTRWNASSNTFEMYDGIKWTAVTQGWEKKETLADSVSHAVDTIAMSIEEDYKDNVTIQDAYREWMAATERFRVVLTMAE